MARKLLGGADLNSQRVQNMADGSGPADAVTKAQLDAMLRGLDWKSSARAATTAAITLSAAQTVDGVALAVGDRVLVKDQATTSTNGIYIVAAAAWTRATDYDDGVEVTAASIVPVEEGTTNGDAAFVLITDGAITVGTTGLVFTRVGGAGVSYTAGNGLKLTGAAFSVVAGAGLIVDATSLRLDPSYTGLAKRFSIDNTASATNTVTHGLGTDDVVVQVKIKATGEIVDADVVALGTSVVVTFPTAPAAGVYRINIIG